MNYRDIIHMYYFVGDMERQSYRRLRAAMYLSWIISFYYINGTINRVQLQQAKIAPAWMSLDESGRWCLWTSIMQPEWQNR